MKIAFFVLTLLLIIAVGIIILLLRNQGFYVSFGSIVSPTPAPTLTLIPTQTPTATEIPTRTGVLNKKIFVPVTGSSSEIGYTVAGYEITSEVIVKGQKATAVEGRKFLIIDIKIENPLDKAIELNTRDYIRLSVNNSGNWLAPDIHNDPVEVQALSTKYTRIGFAINETDSGFSLQLGELNGPKELVNL